MAETLFNITDEDLEARRRQAIFERTQALSRGYKRPAQAQAGAMLGGALAKTIFGLKSPEETTLAKRAAFQKYMQTTGINVATNPEAYYAAASQAAAKFGMPDVAQRASDQLEALKQQRVEVGFKNRQLDQGDRGLEQGDRRLAQGDRSLAEQERAGAYNRTGMNNPWAEVANAAAFMRKQGRTEAADMLEGILDKERTIVTGVGGGAGGSGSGSGGADDKGYSRVLTPTAADIEDANQYREDSPWRGSYKNDSDINSVTSYAKTISSRAGISFKEAFNRAEAGYFNKTPFAMSERELAALVSQGKIKEGDTFIASDGIPRIYHKPK